MQRLNYFFPYQSKADHHEDQLTRAFMVVLRHSQMVANIFYDICREKYFDGNVDSGELLPSLSKIVGNQWEFDTQRSNPVIETKFLVSLLITDETLQTEYSSIVKVERTARYDGIISIGPELTMVIENKPSSYNVWFNQLSPSKENLSEDTLVFRKPIIIKWSDIIKMLTGLLKTGVPQQLLIEDFLSYIDTCYPQLNPYDKFGLCKNNEVLLERRIKNILEKVAFDSSRVSYHRGWSYKIDLGLPQIKMIGLALGMKDNDWWIELSMIAGNTVNQSRELYRKLDYERIFQLEDLYLRPDFHCGFMTTNLIWFQVSNTRVYVEHWQKHPEEIKQYKGNQIDDYLYKLHNKGVIIYNSEEQKRYDDLIYGTTVNMCPGLGLIWELHSEEAIKLDDDGNLEQMIADKIHYGLSVLGTSTIQVRKNVAERNLS